jgi:hypothetical protein
MRDPKTFRRYAEECQRLAAKMPQHKQTLLEMADAWLACASAADARANGSHEEVERSGTRNGE